MESVTIKIDQQLAKEMGCAMKPYYSTKTEFIREAIRDKLKQMKKEQALQQLSKRFGNMKNDGTMEDEAIRQMVTKEFLRKLE